MKKLENRYICKLNILSVKNTLFTLIALLVSSFAIAQSNQAPELDQRAYKYYSQEQIDEMDAVTISQLNFIFNESFVVNTDKICDICPTLNLDEFDVYEHQRQANRRTRVYVTNPGNPIDILSYEELDIELERIKNEFQSTTEQN